MISFFLFKGFRIASIGLFGILSGFMASANQSLYSLLKLFPYHPMIPVNSVILHLSGLGVDVIRFDKLLWGINTLPWVFGWCIAVGIFALAKKSGRKFLTALYFLASASSFGWTLYNSPVFTIHQKLLLHSAAVSLLVCQFFVLYSLVRSSALARWKRLDDTEAAPRPILPPTSKFLFIILLLIMPLLADLHNQFDLVETPAFATSIFRTSGDKTMKVTAQNLNVRTGPSIERPVVDVLPYGSTVTSLGENNGWVKIEKKRWVSKKYLRPTEK